MLHKTSTRSKSKKSSAPHSKIFVLDTNGRVQATSNWRDADSFLGEDLSFRAYFQTAVRGEPGRFYGIGSTTGEAGYYLAHGLEEHGKIIGVAVIKVRLDTLEERWQRARLEAFGAAGQASKIKAIALDKMAERYKKGELDQIIR